MPKILSINEMIYKTLTTKETKTPKYKEVLEALGFELVKGHGWSEYDYWAIKLKEDDRILVISKGRDKQKRLYKTAQPVKTKDIARVNFANLIKTDRSATRVWNRREPETKIQKYKHARLDYETDMSICEDYKRRVRKAEEELEKEKEYLVSWEKRAAQAKERLDEIVVEIKRKEIK